MLVLGCAWTVISKTLQDRKSQDVITNEDLVNGSQEHEMQAKAEELR